MYGDRDWAKAQHSGSVKLAGRNGGLRCNAQENSDELRRNLSGARRMFEDDFVRFVVAYQLWREEQQPPVPAPENTFSQDTSASRTPARGLPISHNLSETYRRLLNSYVELSRLERSSWETSECLNVDEGVRSFADVLKRDFPWWR